MSKITTRRLFAVLVALLVVCSFAGGPAVAAAAASGTFGDDVDGAIGSGGDSPDSSSDGDTSDDSGDGTGDSEESRDDSTDDSAGDDSTEDSSEESTDDSGENSSTDASDDVTRALGDRLDETGETVEDTADGVGGTVDGTRARTTATGYTLVGAVADTADLEYVLAQPDDGRHRTARARSGVAGPQQRYASGAAAADGGTADTGSGGTATLAVDDGRNSAADAGGDGDQPLPSGLSGGATLGLGALAAVAVARSTPLVGSTVSGGGSSGYLATLLDKVRPFVFPLRYSRYDDSDPLEHEARELVYEIVNETPGSYLSEVSERAGLPLSTTRHHMKVLEREELVSGAKLRGKRRFYPAYAEGIELAAALNDESTASIIDALARLGAASVSDLAEDLGLDPSTISHHLQRLEEDEIISREREGRAVMNTLSSEARTALQPETTPRPGEAAEALAD
jgi:DNA-binding transcriptional ArsR family regulator